MRLTALFDIGNTRLHFGWWDGARVMDPRSVSYPDSPEEFIDLITELFAGHDVERCAICSVSIRRCDALIPILKTHTFRIKLIEHPDDIPFTVEYDRPETIGIDRVLAAHAAYRSTGGACVVVDAGTAVTVDAIGGDGALLGGFIYPGNELMSRVLDEKTDLPYVTASDVDGMIGKSTRECIALALRTGSAGAISAMIDKAIQVLEANAPVYLTGGNADFVDAVLGQVLLRREYLVLEGLGWASNSLQ